MYDFDKTIYDGDSTADFYLYALGKHKKNLLLAPSLAAAAVKYYVFRKGTKTPICNKLGIRCLIASEVDPHTGQYSGENCHGEEKVRRFRAQFGQTEIDAFYSDSHSDDPLARIAKQAFMVKGESLSPWQF